MNIHRLKKKQKHINSSLAQHYKKRHKLNQNIETLESVKKDTKIKIEQLQRQRVNNKKGVKR